MTIFGERLKEYRRIHDLTQQELGEKVGVTKQAISRYESSPRVPNIVIASRFAEVMGVSLSWLSGEDEEGIISAPTSAPALSPNRRALLELAETATDEEVNMLLRLAKAVLAEHEK